MVGREQRILLSGRLSARLLQFTSRFGLLRRHQGVPCSSTSCPSLFAAPWLWVEVVHRPSLWNLMAGGSKGILHHPSWQGRAHKQAMLMLTNCFVDLKINILWSFTLAYVFTNLFSFFKSQIEEISGPCSPKDLMKLYINIQLYVNIQSPPILMECLVKSFSSQNSSNT